MPDRLLSLAGPDGGEVLISYTVILVMLGNVRVPQRGLRSTRARPMPSAGVFRLDRPVTGRAPDRGGMTGPDENKTGARQ